MSTWSRRLWYVTCDLGRVHPKWPAGRWTITHAGHREMVLSAQACAAGVLLVCCRCAAGVLCMCAANVVHSCAPQHEGIASLPCASEPRHAKFSHRSKMPIKSCTMLSIPLIFSVRSLLTSPGAWGVRGRGKGGGVWRTMYPHWVYGMALTWLS